MLALMVIDVQQGLFDSEQPREGEAVVQRIAGLIARARAAKVPIFYVQHDGGSGDELDRNGPGFAFRSEVTPRPGDSITVKHHSSAFRDTNLDDKLKAAGIKELVICGMQTEYCVDTTVRAATERGYRVTVACDAHTTFDSAILPAETIIAHTHHIWNGRFARLHLADDIRFTQSA
jgi:nicotinamidase-related amidase